MNKQKNIINIFLIVLFLLAGTSFAESWNLGDTFIVNSINMTGKMNGSLNMGGYDATNATNISAKIIGGEVRASQYDTLNTAVGAGRDVYVGNGTYIITTSIILSSNQSLRCAKEARLIASGNIDVISGQNLRNVFIQGCDVRGGSQNGMSFTNISDSTFSGNYIHGNSLKGIVIIGNSYGNTISQNNISSNGQEGISFACDLASNTCPSLNIASENNFIANGVYGGLGAVTQTATINPSKIIFSKNIIIGAGVSLNCISLIAANDSLIDSNICSGFTRHGFDIGIIPTGRAYNNVISNNYITSSGNSGYYGIRIQYADNTTVIGNVVINQSGGVGISENSASTNWYQGNKAYVELGGGNSLQTNNYGTPGFNWGTFAGTATSRPSAFGANDVYRNTSKSLPNICVSTASGMNNWKFENGTTDASGGC